MINVEKIKIALADPNAPWYGSDLVPWVADLVEEYEALLPPVCSKYKGSRKVYDARLGKGEIGKPAPQREFPCSTCQIPTGEVEEFVEEARKYCNSVIEYAHFVKDNATEEKKEEITKRLYDLLFEGFEIITAQDKRIEVLKGFIKWGGREEAYKMWLKTQPLLQVQEMPDERRKLR